MSIPGLVTKLLTPKTIWYQTDLTVVLRVMLQEVEDYYLHVTSDHLVFSTTANSKDYCLLLYLFGPVIAGGTAHKNTGREIKITLTKAHKWLDWPRLEMSDEKNSMISFDMDHLEDRNWSKNLIKPKEMSVQEYKNKNYLNYIKPDVPSSDEEESDDEYMDKLFY